MKTAAAANDDSTKTWYALDTHSDHHYPSCSDRTWPHSSSRAADTDYTGYTAPAAAVAVVVAADAVADAYVAVVDDYSAEECAANETYGFDSWSADYWRTSDYTTGSSSNP